MIEHVAILGAGQMGSWIAAEVAQAGVRTTVIDPSISALEALSQKGLSDRLHVGLSEDLGAAADADLVIETVTEDIQIKAATYARLADIVRDDAIVTSNTSILLASEFTGDAVAGGALLRSPRFAYLHFLLPKTAVEIMPTAESSPETIRRLVEFAASIGELRSVSTTLRHRPFAFTEQPR